MRICTLTCHNVYNYGASLQAFALQRYLQLLGHDVRIIDYQPDYLSGKYRLSWYVNEKSPYFERCKKNPAFRIIYILRRYLLQYKTIGRKLSFDRFLNKYFRLTQCYDSYITLCREHPEADLYIAGSDQIWNNDPLLNGWDAAFFLDFGDDKTKRISYAASFGSTKTCPDIMKRRLKRLDAISIREESSLSLVDALGITAKVVCDPVFLLSKDEWEECIPPKNDVKPYVFVYDLGGNNAKILKDARLLAKHYGLDIHFMAIYGKQRGVKNIKNAGPERFIREIMNARYVLSDSFHATSFSLIFRKEFFTYTFKNRQASLRMTNFLDKIGLMSRFDCQDVVAVPEMTLEDYDNIGNRLGEYIKDSKDWLNLYIDD